MALGAGVGFTDPSRGLDMALQGFECVTLVCIVLWLIIHP